MLLLLELLILITSSVLAWQDFKTRYISIYLLLLLLMINLTLVFFSVGVEMLVSALIPNITFLLILLTVLAVYTRIRFRGKVSFFKEAFALGDIIFLLAVIPLFKLKGFILFFSTAAVLAIVMTLILIKRKKLQETQIPFVSYMALVLIFILLINFISWENFRFFTEQTLNF